jgi:hypothetical protein
VGGVLFGGLAVWLALRVIDRVTLQSGVRAAVGAT